MENYEKQAKAFFDEKEHRERAKRNKGQKVLSRILIACLVLIVISLIVGQ